MIRSAFSGVLVSKHTASKQLTEILPYLFEKSYAHKTNQLQQKTTSSANAVQSVCPGEHKPRLLQSSCSYSRFLIQKYE